MERDRLSLIKSTLAGSCATGRQRRQVQEVKKKQQCPKSLHCCNTIVLITTPPCGSDDITSWVIFFSHMSKRPCCLSGSLRHASIYYYHRLRPTCVHLVRSWWSAIFPVLTSPVSAPSPWTFLSCGVFVKNVCMWDISIAGVGRCHAEIETTLIDFLHPRVCAHRRQGGKSDEGELQMCSLRLSGAEAVFP